VQAIEVWDANMAQVEGHVDEIGGIYQFVDRHT
jgi:ClpP class serine protease